MSHITSLGESLGSEVIQGWEEPANLSAMEQQIRHFVVWLGSLLLSLWLKIEAVDNPPKAKPCPYCQGTAHYQRQREGTLLTMFGQVKYRCAYYTCRTCHQGHYPLDERLGLRPNQMSAEVERIVWTKAHKLMGEPLPKSSRTGKRKLPTKKCKRDARPVLRLYGTLDGALMHIRGDEENPWRELKIGAWFQARGHLPQTPDSNWRIQAENITYFADVCDAQPFGELVWASGVQRHADQAVELIFIGDGAAWIWRLVEQYFPDAIQIVDWFHTCEYLVDVARMAFPETKQRHTWLRRTAPLCGMVNWMTLLPLVKFLYSLNRTQMTIPLRKQ